METKAREVRMAKAEEEGVKGRRRKEKRRERGEDKKMEV